jgi:hypothetical protein
MTSDWEVYQNYVEFSAFLETAAVTATMQLPAADDGAHPGQLV